MVTLDGQNSYINAIGVSRNRPQTFTAETGPQSTCLWRFMRVICSTQTQPSMEMNLEVLQDVYSLSSATINYTTKEVWPELSSTLVGHEGVLIHHTTGAFGRLSI